jgi:acyl carrier protein phosphodiesterase
MNYLAHAYLNGRRTNEVLMGNLMGDYIKGKQYQNFSLPIQEGILLHRAIDTFTDAHPIVSKTKSFFRADYGLFSGPIVDVLFDYYIANDKAIFASDMQLQQLIKNVYTTINDYPILMPEKMQYMTGYMIKYDWLYHYQFVEGINKSWLGMSKRYERMNDAQNAIKIFATNKELFGEFYKELMGDLKSEFWR